MIRKVPCLHCKGNKIVRITDAKGQLKNIRCPECAGSGYLIRVSNLTR